MTIQARGYTGPLRDLYGDVRKKFDSADEATASAATGGGTSYTPGSGASWASPAPSTVSEALDRLSAAIAAAHSAP